jgi:hypothetical protein
MAPPCFQTVVGAATVASRTGPPDGGRGGGNGGRGLGRGGRGDGPPGGGDSPSRSLTPSHSSAVKAVARMARLVAMETEDSAQEALNKVVLNKVAPNSMSEGAVNSAALSFYAVI